MEYVVVDTDVASFLFKHDSRAMMYKPVIEQRTLVLSFMSLAELERWMLERNWGPRKIQGFQSFLSQFIVFPFHRALCRSWAEVIHRRYKIGRPLSVPDAWIAATAIFHSIPLVTHNAADYAEIPGLQLLTSHSK